MIHPNQKLPPLKDLKYWRERLGQITWRLGYLRADLAEMERDLAECEVKINELTGQENSHES